MIGLLISISLCVGSAIVFWRAVDVVDRMTRCTCNAVALSWLGLAVGALWLFCATLTGKHLQEALVFFVIASAAVMATDRRCSIRNRRRPS